MSEPLLYVATRKGLFTALRRDSSWGLDAVAFTGDNCSAVLPDSRDGALYVALDHGHFGVKLHRSENNGASWEEIPAPSYPQDGEEWQDGFGRSVPNSLEMIWSLEAGHATRPGQIWCGTVPGALFRSDDRGHSWEMVRGLWDHPLRRKWAGGGMDYPGIHSICVHPNDPDRLTIAVSCGGVWESSDGGDNWECLGEGWRSEYLPPEQAGDPAVQDPHRLVQCRAQPERLWVQHHNGIFRSNDGGRRWQELRNVAPSVFGFAAAVHPDDPDTAWFVPAIKDEQRIPVDGRVLVTRTRDGGESFDILSQGLPQTHAYDLIYRHGLDVDDSGEWLALASTTGSLWISEDQGERWREVSAHLPPVYAVRFATRP
jgi:photosystem II stability/assembly factor-like uncharacterized protein